MRMIQLSLKSGRIRPMIKLSGCSVGCSIVSLSRHTRTKQQSTQFSKWTELLVITSFCNRDLTFKICGSPVTANNQTKPFVHTRVRQILRWLLSSKCSQFWDVHGRPSYSKSRTVKVFRNLSTSAIAHWVGKLKSMFSSASHTIGIKFAQSIVGGPVSQFEIQTLIHRPPTRPTLTLHARSYTRRQK